MSVGRPCGQDAHSGFSLVFIHEVFWIDLLNRTRSVVIGGHIDIDAGVPR
jgi:hypothetical protein